MKEVISPHARIVDPFAEKEGGFNMGNLAKTVLAGLGIHSAIDFFRNRKVDDTKQDKRDQDELKKIDASFFVNRRRRIAQTRNPSDSIRATTEPIHRPSTASGLIIARVRSISKLYRRR